MIFGLGTDIIRIDRIAAAVARHGDRFAQRILGPQEMEMKKFNMMDMRLYPLFWPLPLATLEKKDRRIAILVRI